MGPKHPLAAVVLVAACAARAWALPCPEPAAVVIQADDDAGVGEVVLTVEGEMLPDAAPCDGDGATSYATTVVCRGPGGSRCGEVRGLRPGAWVHRVRALVPGSDPQVQRKRSVVLAAPGVPNIVSWTIYARSIVVRQATDGALRAALDAAADFTAANPTRHALVTFDAAAFPGADAPTEIQFGFTPLSKTGDSCRPAEVCADGSGSTYCFDGSNVVVDGLDRLGRAGGVVVRIGKCERSIFRVTGAGNVLRGLVLRGSEKPPPASEVDSVVFSGLGALGNRLEQSVVQGPTKGDAVTVANQAGAPGGGGETVIAASEVVGAEGKGIKVAAGAHLALLDSCLHDNANGGVQLLGGTVSAVRNVVQLSRGGAAPHGFLAGVLQDAGPSNVLMTDGNVVRFSGGRGISVVNASSATLRHDVVAENQVVGLRVESAVPDVAPQAHVRGLGLACNYKVVAPVTKTCAGSDLACNEDGDCGAGVSCRVVPPAGLGAVVGACPDCMLPSLDLGQGGRDAGRNALTLNANPGGLGGGANLRNPSSLVTRGLTIPARGNQWESCGTDGGCDVTAVRKRDIDPPDTLAAAELGEPVGPRGGLAPVIVRMVPARPRAGAFVRLYNGSLDGVGGTFNAIEGAACSDAGDAPIGLPDDPCSPASPPTAARNAAGRGVNRVTITTPTGPVDAEVHAVTPTMLVFRMPVECLAPVTVVASRGASASPPATLCDPGPCADRPAGEPCDDGDVCSVGERCDARGACVAPAALSCSGPCLTGACDPVTGCVVAETDPSCDDGNPCTTDRCAGRGACRFAPVEDGTTCPRADVCRSGQGTCQAGTCDGGPALVCDDGNLCTDDVGCDPRTGCTFAPVGGVRRTTCVLDTARLALASRPVGGGAGVVRRLRNALDQAERWAVRGERAKRVRRARAARAQARVALRGFVASVRRNGDVLGRQLGRQLVRLGQQAIDTLRAG